MVDILFLKIYPECPVFFEPAPCENSLSNPQKILSNYVKTLHTTVEQLNLLKSFEFSEYDKKAIERGAHYAITESLKKKFSQGERITLTDLQNILNKEFNVDDKRTIDFIIKTILDNDSIPFALSLIPYSFKFDNTSWCNGNNPKNSLEYRIKAKSDFTKKKIIFEQKLLLKNAPANTQGLAHLRFSVDQQKQIKLLPVTMEFTFTDKQVFTGFKKKLDQDFQNWIFQPKIHWQINDLWVIPSLLGCLIGLSAMISFIALGLTPISPLLLPPIGLALGLGLAAILNTCVQISINKEKQNIQRPIHLDQKLLQTTTLFNRSVSANTSMTTERPLALNK